MSLTSSDGRYKIYKEMPYSLVLLKSIPHGGIKLSVKKKWEVY